MTTTIWNGGRITRAAELRRQRSIEAGEELRRIDRDRRHNDNAATVLGDPVPPGVVLALAPIREPDLRGGTAAGCK